MFFTTGLPEVRNKSVIMNEVLSVTIGPDFIPHTRLSKCEDVLLTRCTFFIFLDPEKDKFSVDGAGSFWKDLEQLNV